MAKKKAKGGTKCVVPKTKKIGGKVYKVGSKNMTKPQAKAAAERHRRGGKNRLARVLPNPCGTGFRVAKRG